MITIAYTDLLLTVLTVCAVILTVAVVAGVIRARATLRRLDRLMLRSEALLPEVARLADEATEAVQSVHEIADRTGGMARDLEIVTAEARDVALPVLRELQEQVSMFRSGLRHASALIVGAKAGLSALARSKS